MLQKTIERTCEWLTTGKVDASIFADSFQFISPFHQEKDKTKFLEDFQNKTYYKDRILSGIKKFDPIIQLISPTLDYFAIVLQYSTQNGESVWETVLGKVNAEGLLLELRSIYDLAATKKAHQLE
jgi:hypothetical protein